MRTIFQNLWTLIKPKELPIHEQSDLYILQNEWLTSLIKEKNKKSQIESSNSKKRTPILFQ